MGGIVMVARVEGTYPSHVCLSLSTIKNPPPGSTDDSATAAVEEAGGGLQ